MGMNIAQGRGGEDNVGDNNNNGKFDYGKNVTVWRRKRRSNGRGGSGGGALPAEEGSVLRQ
jgi:hypothetical protein